MKKKISKVIVSIALLCIAVTPVSAATDYSTLSNEDLNKVRSTLRNASQEDRDALRQEWQKRQETMTAEERKLYTGPRQSGAVRDGSGMGQGRGKGRGMGRQAQ